MVIYVASKIDQQSSCIPLIHPHMTHHVDHHIQQYAHYTSPCVSRLHVEHRTPTATRAPKRVDRRLDTVAVRLEYALKDAGGDDGGGASRLHPESMKTPGLRVYKRIR